jgi:hypothetical protein
MLDDVERRRLLVEPARKGAVELALGIGDVQLDEGAGQLLDLPGRGRLAGAQPDDDVADAQRLAGLQREVALDAVALVEQTDHGDALVHRRRPRRLGGDGLRDVDRLRLGAGLAVPLALGRAFRAAAGERGERR